MSVPISTCSPFPGHHKFFFLHLRLYFCFANQFICNLFKKYSTYKRYHIFVFLSDLPCSVWKRTLALTLGVMLAPGRVQSRGRTWSDLCFNRIPGCCEERRPKLGIRRALESSGERVSSKMFLLISLLLVGLFLSHLGKRILHFSVEQRISCYRLLCFYIWFFLSNSWKQNVGLVL